MPSDVKLTSRLPQIARTMPERVKIATRLGAEMIAKDAQDRVPVRTGALKNAIHVTFQGGEDYNVVAGDHDAFYGHMVEHGTTRAAPRPFLIPALEARRREVQALVTRALQRL